MLKELSLLYVEDDKSMQEYMKDLIIDEVSVFYQAYDGEEGFEIYTQKKPDVILCDISMPKMDGFEMSKKIKDIDYEQIIIFFSTLDNVDHIKKALEININGFISKPMGDIEDFIKYIESKLNIIRLKKAQKELAQTRFEKEKLAFMLQTIKEISHHWRQPLTIIDMYASIFSFKDENNLELTKDDVKNAKLISQQVSKLSYVLKEVESLDYHSIKNVKHLSELIKISNPIYE